MCADCPWHTHLKCAITTIDADSEEINLMGLYIMSRSNGLGIETPAVRY
jgi:hypothetical protein